MIIDFNIIFTKRDVMLGFGLDVVGQFIRPHGRHGDFFNNNRVAGDGDGDFFLFELESAPQLLDGIHHRALIHNRSVDDGLRQQRLHTKRL